MKTIQVGVTPQMDGYTFSLMPSARMHIKRLIPHARPVNTIFVAYDTKSDFELYLGTLEKWILPALLGIGKSEDLSQIPTVEFIDKLTGKVLLQIAPHDKEIQSELLSLYSRNVSDEELLQIRDMLAQFFADRATKRANEVWKEKGLDAKEILNRHRRTSYQKVTV